MLIQTKDGLVQIKDIKVGDQVLTHNGTYENVTNKFIFNDHKKIIDINGIKCTPNHKFYVANISDIDKITESNYKDFCYWVEAKDLDEKTQRLLKISNNKFIKIEFIEIKKSNIVNSLSNCCRLKSNIEENLEKTYDIEVGISHSYNINGIIVHNSACLTRQKTGVGRPNMSAIIEVADVCHQSKSYCLCNGGLDSSGDICKAFCAGSDFVMSGSLFAGTDEAEGDIIERNGKKYKQYYGMSSKLAQEKHFGGFQNHRASEGREKLIPYVGSLSDVIQDIAGGLRSCCTYIGSDEIRHMSKHATFYKVKRQLDTKFANCPDI